MEEFLFFYILLNVFWREETCRWFYSCWIVDSIGKTPKAHSYPSPVSSRLPRSSKHLNHQQKDRKIIVSKNKLFTLIYIIFSRFLFDYRFENLFFDKYGCRQGFCCTWIAIFKVSVGIFGGQSNWMWLWNVEKSISDFCVCGNFFLWICGGFCLIVYCQLLVVSQ